MERILLGCACLIFASGFFTAKWIYQKTSNSDTNLESSVSNQDSNETDVPNDVALLRASVATAPAGASCGESPKTSIPVDTGGAKGEVEDIPDGEKSIDSWEDLNQAPEGYADGNIYQDEEEK